MSETIRPIGINIDLTKGTHSNTVFIDGKLKLYPIKNTEYGEEIYTDYGYWESEVIDLIDNFTSYENVVLNRVDIDNIGTVSISTSTSDDKINFDEYVHVDIDGKIKSTKKRYIKVKIELFAGYSDKIREITFNEDDKNKFNNTDYVLFDGSLSLKKEYSEEMVVDPTWTEDGVLMRKTINLDEFKKIDKLRVNEN